MSDPRTASSLAYSGYHKRLDVRPRQELTEVCRGTPGGEYQRRFWHPIALVDELKEVPLKARALGEDLVVFKDKSGRIGVLHLNCCHRNTSLEFGIIEERGLRCCYHGRLFDIDGRILDTVGDPQQDVIASRVSQGAYPVHVFAGIVFIYMGPPDRIPVFPIYDRFELPGIKLVPGPRLYSNCNWLQIQENAMDPHHTATLHTIPQKRGMGHFADEFDRLPEMSWSLTPGGMIYLGARRVGDNIWVRSAESLGPNLRTISSIFESGKTVKQATPPFLTFWTLPVDDEHSINFYFSHVAEGETMPFDKRRALEIFGQFDDRPYSERQWIPGDHDAMVSQGAVNPHNLEHLGTFDRGVLMFRKNVRNGIDAVSRGDDPVGFYLTQEDVPPTFANDRVVPVHQVADPDTAEGLSVFCEELVKDYLAKPPMTYLK